jgi:hypothetical protein
VIAYWIWKLLVLVGMTFSLIFNYRLIETIALVLLTVVAFILASKREELFRGSEKKQLASQVGAWICLCMALVLPPVLAWHSFYHPNVQLAAEKLGSEYFNPEDYRGLGEEGVAAVLARAQSDPSIPRKNVYQALATIGEAAIPAMNEAVIYGPEAESARAAIPLMGDSAPAVLTPLMRNVLSALSYEYPELTKPASREQFLAQYPEISLPIILEDLKRGEPSERRKAARVLGALGAVAEPARDGLIEALDDEDSVVRQNALWTLPMIGGLDAALTEKAVQMLRDPSEAVRRNARGVLLANSQHAASYAATIKAVLRWETDASARQELMDLLIAVGAP